MSEPPIEPLWEPIDVTLDLTDLVETTTSCNALSFAPLNPPGLYFPCGIAINMATGDVIIPDTLDLTQAARAFWEEIGRCFPGVAPEVPEHERGFGQ